jgi:hypothetical protein
VNTPAHLVVNLALLGRAERPATAPILGGALLPDLPMFLFYAWQKWAGSAEASIWGDLYFRPGWQDFFDVFNSIPLAGLGLLLAALARRPLLQIFFASMLVHLGVDLLVHVDDAHRHFLPFSDWRFVSAVSYWDPRHLGALGAGLEMAGVVASSAVLWRRYSQPPARAALALLSTLYVVGWTLFYGSGLV